MRLLSEALKEVSNARRQGEFLVLRSLSTNDRWQRDRFGQSKFPLQSGDLEN